jgi:hypothetical protein
VQLADEALELRALGTRLPLLEHHRDPMAGEQLFAGLQGLGLISSKHRHHRNALGQVNDHIEQKRQKKTPRDGQ